MADYFVETMETGLQVPPKAQNNMGQQEFQQLKQLLQSKQATKQATSPMAGNKNPGLFVDQNHFDALRVQLRLTEGKRQLQRNVSPNDPKK